MFKQYGRKKRMKKILLITLFLSIMSYFLLIIISNNNSGTDVISKIGTVRIYKNDIKTKFLHLFNNSVDNNSFKIEDLSKEVVESLSKEIYLERQLLESAKKFGIHRSPETKDKILKSKNSIIIESYLDYLVEVNTTEDQINNKYLEIVTDQKNKKEYDVSIIMVKDKGLSKKILKQLSKASLKSLDRKFNSLYRRYSIKKNKPNKEKFVIESKVPAPILLQFDKGDRIATTQIEDEIHIYKYNDSRVAKAKEMDDQYKKEIRGMLEREVMQKFIAKHLGDKKVTILDY